MKITTSLTQERKIEVPVPSFYKEVFTHTTTIINVLGVLDEDTIVSIWHFPDNRVAVENSTLKSSFGSVARSITSGWENITEEEFFTHYNKAMESLSLTPKLTEK